MSVTKVVKPENGDTYPFLRVYKADYINQICILNHVDPTNYNTVKERMECLDTLPVLWIEDPVGLNQVGQPQKSKNDFRIRNIQALKPNQDFHDYMENFEEQCDFQEIPEARRPYMLSPFLTGTAATAWTTIPREHKENWELTKSHLLASYEISAQKYRKDCISSFQKSSKMTFVEYGNLLLKKLKRWLLVDVEYWKELLDVEIFHEFLEQITIGLVCQRYENQPELIMKLTSRFRLPLLEAMKIADEFEACYAINSQEPVPSLGSRPRSSNRILCNHCGKTGHLVNDCFKNPQSVKFKDPKGPRFHSSNVSLKPDQKTPYKPGSTGGGSYNVSSRTIHNSQYKPDRQSQGHGSSSSGGGNSSIKNPFAQVEKVEELVVDEAVNYENDKQNENLLFINLPPSTSGLYIVGGLGQNPDDFKDCYMYADSGAHSSFLQPRVAEELGVCKEHIKSSKQVFVTANGSHLKVHGTVTLSVKISTISKEHDFYIADIGMPLILGRDLCKKFGLTLDLKENSFSVDEPTSIKHPLIVYDKSSKANHSGETEVRAHSKHKVPLRSRESLVEVPTKSTSRNESAKYDVRSNHEVEELADNSPGTASSKTSQIGRGDRQPSWNDEKNQISYVQGQRKILKNKGEVTGCPQDSELTHTETEDPKHVPQFSTNNEMSLSEKYKMEIDCLIEEFTPSIFTDNIGGCDLILHQIITTDEKPVYTPPYRLSPPKRESALLQVNQMRNMGIIQPSISAYCSSPVLVPKGTDYRFAIDFRKLNAKTLSDRYPLPTTDTLLSYLEGTKVFSLLDIRAAFWQSYLDPADRHKTAFSIAGLGHFEFLRVPFGLKNASGYFQKLIDQILMPILGKFAIALVV